MSDEKSAEIIEIGAIVRLKSGGPNMVVTASNDPEKDDHDICVSWFGPEGNTSYNDTFNVACVVRVPG